jgi:hypothetical protein
MQRKRKKMKSIVLAAALPALAAFLGAARAGAAILPPTMVALVGGTAPAGGNYTGLGAAPQPSGIFPRVTIARF